MNPAPEPVGQEHKDEPVTVTIQPLKTGVIIVLVIGLRIDNVILNDA